MLVLDLWSLNLYRVCTDFWIQTFSTSFSKTIYLFFQVYQIGDEYRPLKKQSKAFFMIHCKHTRPSLNKIWTKQKKFIYKAITALKKKTRLLTIFLDFISLGKFQDFFKTFSRIQNSVWTLPVPSEKKETKKLCSFFLLFPGVASWTLSLMILNASATVASGLNW